MTQQRQDPDQRTWGEPKHQIGDSNIWPVGLDIHIPVFMISSVFIAAFVVIALANQDDSESLWLAATEADKHF